MLTDLTQLVSLIISIVAIFSWIRLRSWPIRISIITAMALNIFFYLAVVFGFLPSPDHNLISAMARLLLVLVLAALPASIKDRTL